MLDRKQETRPTLPRILREPEVVELVGLAAITIWHLEKEGRFPRRRKLTSRAVGWREDEVAAWIESRPQVGAEEEAQG